MRALAFTCLLLSLLVPMELTGGPLRASEEATEVLRPGSTGLPLPRFVSLRASEVNVRTGPGFRYPIEWVYRRRNQPVEVIDEYDTWRRIRDWEGTEGWVHQSMLQGRRTARVVEEDLLLRQEPAKGASAVAQLKVGAIGALSACEADWCQIDFSGHVGWLPRGSFYGIYPDESLN